MLHENFYGSGNRYDITYINLLFRLDLLYLRGKRGRKVPVLLTKDILKAIVALNDTRDAVGIKKENKYIFAAKVCQNLSLMLSIR